MNAEESKSSEYLKYVDEIIANFVTDIEKKHELHYYGSGGNMPTDIEKIDVLFISYIKSTVADARKMELAVVQELLHRINNHKKIRPYLREYPFGSDRVHISISFRTETNDRPLDGSVALVSLVNNKIYYDAAEIKMSAPIPLTRIKSNNEWTKELIPGKLQEELIPLMKESYEEALKIVGTTSGPTQK
ncbi:MAG: hypothetical protein K2X08_05010 [Chlamydiales bacterium]|nr:hypothetical protein [Chlamydiales bacterium]